MSKSNAYETSVLALLLNATTIANVANNAASAPLTNLYLSLHTADPGEAGTQATNEATYTSYARVAVPRDAVSADRFIVSGDTATLGAIKAFPQASGGSELLTHFGVGSSVSGAGVLYYSGTITPNISVTSGVTPRLTTGTQITES